MFTLAAWIQSVNPGSAYVQLAAPADPILTVNSPKILCPPLNQVVMLAGGGETLVAPRVRLVSPSLLTLDRFQISPLNTAAAASVLPNTPTRYADLKDNPLQLVVGEQMTMELFSGPAAPQIQWGLLWLADGAIKPVTGKIYTVRATATIAATSITWTNGAIVFDDALPRGRYQIVGFRGQSATMIAARLVIPGTFWRPGCIGAVDATYVDTDNAFRYGNFGVYGEFEDTAQPTVDILCAAADAAEVFFLDLIQIRSGP